MEASEKRKAQMREYRRTHKEQIMQNAIDNKKKIDQLTNNWNELEEWVKQRIDKIKYNSYDDILDKMKKIKENNENS